MKIYVVEDSATVCNRLIDLIKGIAGAESVGSSESAPQAIEEIASARPDVIVLDLALKQGTGFDVLLFAKQLNPAPMVIVQTNYANAAFRQRSLRAGADFFFDKSIEFENLASVLNKMAGGAPRADAAGASATPRGKVSAPSTRLPLDFNGIRKMK